MKFIELTEPDGKKFVVNAAHIVKMVPTQDERYLALIQMTDSRAQHVKESVPEILAIISKANEV